MARRPDGWTAGFIAVVVGAVAVGVVGGAGPWIGEARTIPALWVVGLVAFLVNWIVLVPSTLARTERFFDLTGSITYLSCLAIAAALAPRLGGRDVLLLAMVAVWTIRLGTFLFVRIRSAGVDRRFDQLKVDPAEFFMTWTLQGLWVLMTGLAAFAAILIDRANDLDGFAVVGAVVWVAGFGIEVVADAQKRRFSGDPANRGRFITSGLWSWSRHPNYFGEIVLWFGVAVAAAPSFAGRQLVALVAPLFVALLLTRVSGIPLLEARATRRWGHESGYRRYVDDTPVLVPRRPRASRRGGSATE